MYCGKMADCIEVLFGAVGRVGPRNYLRDVSAVPPMVNGKFWGRRDGAMSHTGNANCSQITLRFFVTIYIKQLH